VKQIPNLLSLARLAMAPFLFSLLWRHAYGAALALIVAAGITDWLDGLFARRFEAASRLGAYLDPIADKVLLSGAFLTLALSGIMQKWLAALVLGRDAGILLFAGGAFLFTKSLRSFPPSIWGKASTVAQIAFVVAVVMHYDGFRMELLAMILEWLTVGLTVWSGIDYLARGLAMARRETR
jgi:cardiolipin synthase